MWTGLNDLFVTGMFTWSDQHMVTFTYWAPGEPNNHDGFTEDCVEMLYQVIVMKTIFCFYGSRPGGTCSSTCRCVFQTGRWNDVSCTELNTYICKMPKAHYPLPSVKPTEYGCPQVSGPIATVVFFGIETDVLLPVMSFLGLGCLRLRLLLDGGDGQELVGCKGLL